MKSLQTIGVIGAGTTGTGIAQVCALSGLSVSMLDVDELRAQTAAMENYIVVERLRTSFPDVSAGGPPA
jgi:3-hydroxybutyryl-CoA dehydrogenase